ncbi:hypothetical protein [Novosphingobium sp.]|uniref:hypothetical protein n=1 Tax=Novosphingobium sp. TaxID=1874826 RepID=UPI00273284C9|nr:hypothetical protein [Novosphingobium sp.]MDP3907099.1 hypothetical protein [Novosphingobium sp.]
MSEAKARSERIRGKIAASQERLQRDSDPTPAVATRPPLPDAYPPESYRSLAAEYPWLVVAAGAGLGLLAGALVPRRFGGKLGGRLLTVATLAADIGLAISKQAGQTASTAASDKLGDVGSGAARLRARLGRSAGSARSTGLMLAGEAIRLAARARRKSPGASS